MRKWLVIISLLLCSWSMAAQTDSVRLGYSLRGRVVDAVSGQALESVYVSTPGKHHATVTNADGSFTLKSDSPIVQLEFTHLGYKKLSRPAAENMKIALQRESLSLAEASIISGDPLEIVKTALGRRQETFCTEAELLECFYRETIRKRNRYIYVAEAVARLFKSPFNGTVYDDAAALEKSRVLVSQRRHDTLSVVTLGGPTLAIQNDILKNNSFLFNIEDMELYSFHMELPAYIGDRLQFVVRMEPAQEADYALFHCTLYIDRELLTFTRIEAFLDMSDPGKATKSILISKPIGLRFFPEETSMILNYSLKEGKSRLEYFRSTIRFACDWRRRLFKTRYTAVNELVVTDVRPEPIRISRKDRFNPKDCLSQKAPEFLDPDFWKDYNIIEASESLEHAIGRLRK